MRKMKDSGIEWIGEIPREWEVCRLGKIANIATGNTPPKVDNSKYYSSDGMKWIKADNLTGLTPITKTNEYLNDEGVKIAKIAPAFSPIVCCIGSIGKVGYSEEDSAYNQQLNAIIFSNKIFWKFGLYYLIVQEEQHWYYSNGNVLKILNTENQKSIVFPLPPLPEQEKIANYLDTKTSQIDKIIQKENLLIEKLKEYKQSLITETVTKGLNKNAPTKDSGIEWIGKIASHWEVVKLKNCAYINNGRDAKNVEVECSEYPIYGSGGIFGYASSFLYDKPSVLLGRKGTIDKPIFVENPFWTVDTMFYTTIKDLVKPKFFYYQCCTIQFDLYQYGSAVPSMSQSTLNVIQFALPPLSEQKAIANFLDQKCSAIDSAISKKQNLIEKLNEYKKSLIYEVVTGKREV